MAVVRPTGNYYKVQSDGTAPKGLSVGDLSVTGGGTYIIMDVKDDGSYYSEMYDPNLTTYNFKGTYSKVGSSGSKNSSSSSSSDGSEYQQLLEDMEAQQAERDAAHAAEIEDLKGQINDYATENPYQFDEAFWNKLNTETQNAYDDYLAKMQQSYADQLQLTKNEYEAQKDTINDSYNNLYDQLHTEKINNEKNLNQILKAQGISGGMTESSALRLANDYTAALNQAEQQRIKNISEVDRAIANAELTSNISQSQLEAEIQQAAQTALQNLALQMQDQKLTIDQLNEARQQWAQQMQLSIAQWDAEYQQAADSMKMQVAQMAAADLQAKAETLSAYGDFSGYAALGYSDEEINAMQSTYMQMLANSTGQTYSSDVGYAAPVSDNGGYNGEYEPIQEEEEESEIKVTENDSRETLEELFDAFVGNDFTEENLALFKRRAQEIGYSPVAAENMFKERRISYQRGLPY